MIAVALLAAASCDKQATDSPPPSDPGKDGVQLVTLGSEPRRPVRYHLTKGAHTPLELAMDLDLDVTARPMKMPRIVMILDIAVEDVLAGGSAKLRTVAKDVKIVDRPGATLLARDLESMREMIVGLTYASTLSPDGTMSGGEITSNAPPKLKDQLAEMTGAIEQVAMRLPPVPVGVGARWSSKKTTTRNGISITTVTTTQLTSLDGDKLGFAVETTLSAPNQKSIQQGVPLDIQDVGGGGSGAGVIDLATMAMTGTTTSEFRGKVNAGSQTSNMHIGMTMTMK